MTSYRPRAAFTFGPLLLSLVAGCSGAPDEPVTSADAPKGASVPSDWVGYRLGLAAPAIVRVEPVQISMPGHVHDALPAGADEVPDAPSDADSDRTNVVTVVDYERSVRYHLRVGAGDLAALGKVGYESGGNSERDDAPSGDVGSVQQELVTGGKDTRARRALSDGVSATSWPDDTIGQVDTPASDGFGVASCTGVFIGNKIMLTAAHCMYDELGNLAWPTFTPRRDGWTTPWGTWTSSASSVPPTFESLGCNKKWVAACTQWDYAIVLVKQPAGYNFPGYMCVNYRSTASMNAEVLTNRGYPGCDLAGSPKNCVDYTLYGDTRDCVAGPVERYPDSDGWNTVIQHDCDTNQGQSGSPMFVLHPTYHPDCNGSIVGIANADDPAYTKNVMRRITPAEYNTIAYFRSVWK